MTKPTKNRGPSVELVNDPTPVSGMRAQAGEARVEEELTLRDYVAILVDARWIVIALTAVSLTTGALYLYFASPRYEADALVQVEEKKPALSGLEDLSSMFSNTSLADTEIEILRSRMLIGSVVDDLRLDLVAEPRYLPLFGYGVARRCEGPAVAPAVLGLGRFAWGCERIGIAHFEVPRALEGKRFTLVARGGPRFALLGPDGSMLGEGSVGHPVASSGVVLEVESLTARPGEEFHLSRLARATAIERLQRDLLLAEKGKRTGVIRVALQGTDPDRIAAILDAMVGAYARQNVDRRSAEAEKTLEFVKAQLPERKRNVEKVEAELQAYQKDRGGGVDVSVETKSMLDRSAQVEKLLTELHLQRLELVQRFTANHPTVAALDHKVPQLERERDGLERRLKSLPEAELRSARLMRDAKVANELYVLLMNKSQQLEVMKSGTIGNVRVLDAALVPIEPIAPRPVHTLAIAGLLGLGLGILGAFLRKALSLGVEDPEMLERETGLPVYATIPHSDLQAEASLGSRERRGSTALLAAAHPEDLAVEAVRSLRTSLQFALADAKDNVVAITGPSPGTGKSFVAANLAHTLASAGRRVLLVDADLRKGHLHEYFDGRRGPGLSEVVCDELVPEQAVRTTDSQNLWFLATGRRVQNPSELLSSRRFESVMAWAARAYDVVVIDTAPILAVTDGAIVSCKAGTCLVVLRSGKHPMREVALTLRRLAQTGVLTRGVILNDVAPKAAAYGYQYQYEYR